jgi:hydroxyacylglutathione hydrolase
VILLTSDTEEMDGALQQMQGGNPPVIGTLDEGLTLWKEAGLPTATLAEIDVADLTPDRRPSGMVVLDVREPMEWELGHIPEALLIRLGELRDRLEEVPRDQEIAVVCEAGIRSSMASSILQAAGYAHVAHGPAGTQGYRTLGLPLEYY